MKWSFSADHAGAANDMRGPFVSYLRSRAFPDSDFLAAELIFGELVGNVVRHAPGPIAIDVTWEGEHAILAVSDEGPGFDPNVHPALPDAMAEGGRGLFLVRAYAQTVRVESRSGGGSRVSVRLPIRRARAA